MSHIIPAILTNDPQDLALMVSQVAAFTDYAQVDIMDGRFVPSRSVTWQHLVAIPIGFTWEAHLMMVNPEEYLDGFSKAGAKKIIFHHEATSSPEKVISLARSYGLSVGVAINPETLVAAILPLVSELDSVLFLSVNPGFYGSEFIPGVLNKITEFRKLRPEVVTSIDGGVKEANVTEIARTGVNEICVGSAIFKQSEPAASFRRLQTLAETA